MENQCRKRRMVGEAGLPAPLKSNDNFARTGQIRPSDAKELFRVPPARLAIVNRDWRPDQWAGYGRFQ